MRVKPFTSFLAPLALVSLIAAERPAEAVLTYYIYEPAGTGNVVVETLVSLNLPSGVAIEGCSAAPVGVIFSSVAGICIGPSAQLNAYTLISGPFSFIGPDNLFADSASGIATTLVGVSQQFAIDTTYTGGPIISSSTFGMSTLTGLGFTTTGSLAPGPWTERETPSRFGLPLPPHHPPLPLRVPCPSWARRLPLAPCASCAGSPPHSSRADHLALSQPARRLQASEGGPAHVRSGFTTATPAMRRPWPKPSENRTSQRLRMAASAIRASNQLSPSRSAS
jgi:hypothetical protein